MITRLYATEIWPTFLPCLHYGFIRSTGLRSKYTWRFRLWSLVMDSKYESEQANNKGRNERPIWNVIRNFILRLLFPMTNDPKSSGEPGKANCGEDKSPSKNDGLRVAIEQGCANDCQQTSETSTDTSSNSIGQPSWSGSEVLQFFFLGAIIGLICGIILCAVIWHK
jgi:hypothetical protein